MVERPAFLITLALLLLALPGATLGEFEIPARAMGAVAMVLVSLLALAATSKSITVAAGTVPAGLMGGLYVLALLHAYALGTIGVGEFLFRSAFWGATVVFALSLHWATRRRLNLVHSVYISLLVLVAANLSLMLAGVEGRMIAPDRAVMLGWFGIDSDRFAAPSGGVNTFGIFCAALLAPSLSMFLLADGRIARWTAVVGTSASIVGVLMADSRAALAYALAASMLTVIAVRFRQARRIAVIVAIAVMCLFPVMFHGGFDPASWLPSGASRSGEAGELMTLNGRTVMWHEAVMFLKDPAVGHLFGYGFHGHKASGVADSYNAEIDPTVVWDLPVHNAFLQMTLDVGYLGAAIFLGALIVGGVRIVRLFDRDPRSAAVAFSMYLFLVLCGTTEFVMTPYSTVPTVLMLLLLGAAGIEATGGRRRVPQSSTRIPETGAPKRGEASQ